MQNPKRTILVALVFVLISVMAKSALNASAKTTSLSMAYAQSQETVIDTTWRYTRFGWQDSNHWMRTPAQSPRLWIHRIDPVLFSIDIFLAVLATMIWSSEEWQVAKLFCRPSTERRKQIG